MAISKVKADLDSIANGISFNETRIADALAILTEVNADFGEYATRYADTIAEIGAFTPTGAFEELSQDELSKMTSQFMALRSAVTTASEALE